MTIGETMMLAAHLKLGFTTSKEYKQNLVSLLTDFGIISNRLQRSMCISMYMHI